jgi:hypothetical protein
VSLIVGMNQIKSNAWAKQEEVENTNGNTENKEVKSAETTSLINIVCKEECK